MIVAQLTDIHIREDDLLCHGIADSALNLAAVVDQLNGLNPIPDVTLLTGDLTDQGSEAEYRKLRHHIDRLDTPYYLIPGNHDDPVALAAVFADHAYLSEPGSFVNYVIDGFPLRMIGLDSTIPGEIGGRMCADRLHWMRSQLEEEPDRVTLIFMHHPPLETGIFGLDENSFEGKANMEMIIANNPQVERIICGHVHRSITKRFGRTVLTTSPSTAYPFHCDLRNNNPLTVIAEPNGFQLHVWSEASGLVTHTNFIGDHGSPIDLIT